MYYMWWAIWGKNGNPIEVHYRFPSKALFQVHNIDVYPIVCDLWNVLDKAKELSATVVRWRYEHLCCKAVKSMDSHRWYYQSQMYLEMTCEQQNTTRYEQHIMNATREPSSYGHIGSTGTWYTEVVLSMMCRSFWFQSCSAVYHQWINAAWEWYTRERHAVTSGEDRCEFISNQVLGWYRLTFSPTVLGKSEQWTPLILRRFYNVTLVLQLLLVPNVSQWNWITFICDFSRGMGWKQGKYRSGCPWSVGSRSIMIVRTMFLQYSTVWIL